MIWNTQPLEPINNGASRAFPFFFHSVWYMVQVDLSNCLAKSDYSDKAKLVVVFYDIIAPITFS